MEIKTKFNLGDKVWTLRNSKAVEMEIRTATISESGVSYIGRLNDDTYMTAEEYQCFPTKDKLVDYIVKE